MESGVTLAEIRIGYNCPHARLVLRRDASQEFDQSEFKLQDGEEYFLVHNQGTYRFVNSRLFRPKF